MQSLIHIPIYKQQKQVSFWEAYDLSLGKNILKFEYRTTA